MSDLIRRLRYVETDQRYCFNRKCMASAVTGDAADEIERQQSTIDSLRGEVEQLTEEAAEYQRENAALREVKKLDAAELGRLRAALSDAPEPESAWPPNPDIDEELQLWASMRLWYYRTRSVAQSNDTPDAECASSADGKHMESKMVPGVCLRCSQNLPQQDTPD